MQNFDYLKKGIIYFTTFLLISFKITASTKATLIYTVELESEQICIR